MRYANGLAIARAKLGALAGTAPAVLLKQAGTLGAAVAPDRGPIHRHGQRGGKGWQ